MIPTNDEWTEKLKDPAFWARNKVGGKASSASSKPVTSARSNLGGALPASDSRKSWSKSDDAKSSEASSDDNGDETFRTVCVRLCDGSFFPISFSTERDNFEADAAKCEATCPGARLFFHRNPGAEVDDLEDMNGQPYKKLKTAYLFRTNYEPSCKCRPHPWEEAARAQHRVYALEAATAKGDRVAATELTTLTASIKKAEADAAAEKKRVEAERAATAKRLADEQKRMADAKRREADALKATKAADEKAARAAKAEAERAARAAKADQEKAAKVAKAEADKAARAAKAEQDRAAKAAKADDKARASKQAAAVASGATAIKGNTGPDSAPAVSEPKALSAVPLAASAPPQGVMSLGGPSGQRSPQSR